MNNDDTPTPRTDEEAWIEDRARPFELVQADFARTLERELAAAQAELAKITHERDDLRFVLERQDPWNKKAQAYLDAARWAGTCYIQAVITELEERDAQLALAQAELAALRESKEQYQKSAEEMGTPRTDKAWGEWQYAGPGVSVHFARTLERELNATSAQMAWLLELGEKRNEKLAQLRAAQEWRPIEEAPRDGARVLAVTANGFYDVIYYSNRIHYFVGKWSPFVAWTPLPPPPKGGEA